MSPEDCRLAAAYIRVSTDDQVELSPASQLVEIRKWGSANGYIVPDEFVFVDEAKSGRRVTGRDEFRRLIGSAKQKPKPFDAILLWKFSRFARNRDDAVLYKSILRKQLHIEVISIKEPIAEGKLGIIMEAMIEAMDEYYSINLAEDVKRGMEEKHRRGELQSTPSFGYAAQDGILVPLEPEASYVREMFSRFLSGQGFFPIARWLNDMGIKTHRGSAFDNRTVEYILRNPVYIGKLRWNPAGRTRRNYDDPNILVVDGKHQPLVDSNIWNAAQDRISQLKAMHKYHGRPLGSGKDWISGVVRCATCGGTMIFAKPNYWKCNNYVRGRCKTSQHISGDTLKESILARLRADVTASEPLSFNIRQTSSNAADELPFCSSIRPGYKNVWNAFGTHTSLARNPWRSMPPPRPSRSGKSRTQTSAYLKPRKESQIVPRPNRYALLSDPLRRLSPTAPLLWSRNVKPSTLYAIGLIGIKPKTHSQFIIGLFFPNSYMLHRSLLIYGGPDGELGASLRYLSQRYAHALF